MGEIQRKLREKDGLEEGDYRKYAGMVQRSYDCGGIFSGFMDGFSFCISDLPVFLFV